LDAKEVEAKILEPGFQLDWGFVLTTLIFSPLFCKFFISISH